MLLRCCSDRRGASQRGEWNETVEFEVVCVVGEIGVVTHIEKEWELCC